MDLNELERIDDDTAEARLADACPLCDGRLHVRLQGTRGTTWCSTCQHIGHVTLESDTEGGFQLALQMKATA